MHHAQLVPPDDAPVHVLGVVHVADDVPGGEVEHSAQVEGADGPVGRAREDLRFGLGCVMGGGRVGYFWSKYKMRVHGSPRTLCSAPGWSLTWKMLLVCPVDTQKSSSQPFSAVLHSHILTRRSSEPVNSWRPLGDQQAALMQPRWWITLGPG